MLSWRRASLLAAGYDQRLSLKLALRSDVDLHLAVQLGRDGCPAGHRGPDLALVQPATRAARRSRRCAGPCPP